MTESRIAQMELENYYRKMDLYREKVRGAGKAICESRLQHGWSVNDLAQQLGCSRGQLNQIETGHKLPSDELCRRAAELLGLKPRVLLDLKYKAKSAVQPAEPWTATKESV
jgi:transcriptional regulator with XRE-family HTH domain